MPARTRLSSRLVAAVAAWAVAASPAGAQFTFTNTSPITIPAGGTATPYPSSVTVSGYTGTITAVTVTLTGFSHAYTDDVTAVLTGPGLRQTVLFSGAGVDSPAKPGTNVTNLTLTFSDAAALPLPINADFTSGTYRPGLDQYGISLSAPAPPKPYANDFTAFIGQQPNGTYSLWVEDSFADLDDPDGGRIASWSLTLSGITPVPEPAALVVGAAGLGAAAWARRRWGRHGSGTGLALTPGRPAGPTGAPPRPAAGARRTAGGTRG